MSPLLPGRLLALVFTGFALLAGPAAAADDATVVQALIEGRYDRLSTLEQEAGRGDAVAMYWHSVMLEACATDGSCQPEEARRWRLKAAQAGHPRARERIYLIEAANPFTDEPYAPLGKPRSDEERLTWSLGVLTKIGGSRESSDRALQTLLEVHGRAPTMMSAHSLMVWRGSVRGTLAPALLLSGTPLATQAAEMLRHHYLLSERKRFPELLPLAKQGNAAVGIALCHTTSFVDGHSELHAELLPLCVSYLWQGQLELANELLRHHLARGETAQARRYASLCKRLPIPCSELSDYERLELGKTQAWRDRDATLALSRGMQTDDPLPLKVRRDALSLGTRLQETRRTCLLRPYDPQTQTFAPAAGCPLGQPIKLDE